MCRLNGDHSERNVLFLNNCRYNHEMFLLFSRIYSLYIRNFTVSDKVWWPSEKDDCLITFAKCCDGDLREIDLRRVTSGSALRRSNYLLGENLEKLRVWFLRKTFQFLYNIFAYKWPISRIVEESACYSMNWKFICTWRHENPGRVKMVFVISWA